MSDGRENEAVTDGRLDRLRNIGVRQGEFCVVLVT